MSISYGLRTNCNNRGCRLSHSPKRYLTNKNPGKVEREEGKVKVRNNGSEWYKGWPIANAIGIPLRSPFIRHVPILLLLAVLAA